MSSVNGSQNTQGPKWVSARPTELTKKSVPENIPKKLEELGETLKASEQNLGLDTSLAGRITQSPLPLVEVEKEKYASFQEVVKNKGALPKPPQLKRARESEEAEPAETKRARIDSDTESVASSKESKRSSALFERTRDLFLSLFKSEKKEAALPSFEPETAVEEIQDLSNDIAFFEAELAKNEAQIDPRQATHQRDFIQGLKTKLEERKSQLAAHRGAIDAEKMPTIMARYANDKPIKSEGSIEKFIEKNPEGTPHYKILKNIQEQINQAYQFRNDMIKLGKLAQFIQDQPELTETQKNTLQRGLPDAIEGAEAAAKAVKNLETTYFGSATQFEGGLIDPDAVDDETLSYFLNELSSVFGNQAETVKTFSEATSNYDHIVKLTTPLANNPKVESFNQRLIEHGKNIGMNNFTGIKGLGGEYIKPAQRFMRIPMLLEESAKKYGSDALIRNLENSRNAAREINQNRY